MAFTRKISSTATDYDLVLEYKSTGDMEVLAALYSRYMDIVYGVALKYFK